MEKYYFDENEKEVANKDKTEKKNKKTKGKEIVEKITLDLLKQKISAMDVYVELKEISPYRATVLVHKNIGTNMYLASGTDNHFWLRANAVKMEEAGSLHRYHFVFD